MQRAPISHKISEWIYEKSTRSIVVTDRMNFVIGMKTGFPYHHRRLPQRDRHAEGEWERNKEI